MKLCLGIESTAHTFGVGIVDFKGNILANAKSQFTSKSGGMIPNEVAKHHEDVKEQILEQALKQAKVKIQDVKLISYSASPGLAPCLLVGMNFAKSLSKKYKIPLVGVNHSVSHLTVGDLLCKAKDPIYLYVSGPNTQVIGFAGGKYRIFGETLDIGLGNMLDKFARVAGLGFPGGPKIEKIAAGQVIPEKPLTTNHKPEYIDLPYSVKGMDVSFSGMLTKALQLLKNSRKSLPLLPKQSLGEFSLPLAMQGREKFSHRPAAANQMRVSLNDLCFSLQETAFAMLAEVVERALAHTDKNEVVLIGGVAANKRLCRMLKEMCKARKAKFAAVPLEFSGDQGVMIAWQGVLQKSKIIPPDKANIYPYERIDEVVVSWKL